jgi:uncharacterized protein YbaR (Trm112 family)
MHTEALGTLGCPRCGAPLEFTAAALHCQACARGYPLIGEIPCLVPDPPLFRAHWLGQLEEYLAITETRVRELGNERRGEHLLPQTRQRLLSVIRAMDVERASIRERFAALVAGVERLPASAIPTSFVRAGDLPILKCYENVFRDFAWGQRESKLALEHVARLASAALGQMAVFGAGAGRLALDVHRALAPEQSFALDINPLPLLIADELMRGRTLELYEFPIAPHTAEGVAVLERLSYPESVPPGLTLVFADARTPPFRPASLDTVLTPWFIDAVGRDVRETAATIRRVLRPGGMWLNLGPLRFEGPLSRVYAIEEVLELVKQSGFELVQHFREDVPYFDSPFSGSRRHETVFTYPTSICRGSRTRTYPSPSRPSLPPSAAARYSPPV